MKYKAVSTECSRRCGSKRRPGQRLCAFCHRMDMQMRRAIAAGRKARERKP